MDARNSIEKLDKNMISYGHNMKDHSMFGSLKKYKTQQFLDEHKTISLDFLNSSYQWEIFSVYTSGSTEWMKTNFTSKSEFELYLHDVRNRSEIESFIEVTPEDTILTLSTCTNIDEDERIIVHAKLLNGRI